MLESYIRIYRDQSNGRFKIGHWIAHKEIEYQQDFINYRMGIIRMNGLLQRLVDEELIRYVVFDPSDKDIIDIVINSLYDIGITKSGFIINENTKFEDIVLDLHAETKYSLEGIIKGI